MKKILVWATAMAIAAVSSVGLSTPAFAAPVAGPIIAVLGSYNFVSTSADGTITAAFSEASGLSVYNSVTNEVVSFTNTELGVESSGEAVVSPDGAYIYLMGYDPEAITVIDVVAQTIDRTITIPFEAWMGAITPDGQTLIVYSYDSQRIVKVALATDAVSGPLELGLDYPYQMCITSDSSTLYVPGYDAGYTAIVDIASLTETGQLLDDGGPIACALGADDTLYIGDYDTGEIRKYAADGSSIVSASGLVEEMFGIGLTCGSVIVGDYQNTGYVVLDRATLAQTGTIASDVYTYMMTTTRDATTTWVGGYYSEYGLQSITEDTCPDAALPDTGASPSIVGTSLAVSAGLLVAGGLVLFVVRRRNAKN
jgi:LPXTG-motif cell wall-anchored protein